MQNNYYIAFDTAHKPRGRISTNYKSMAADLEKNGYQCFEFAEFPITRQNLANYDILVECCPDFSKISPQEIEAIKQWVHEDGGSLLLLSHAGGDKGRRSNLSELAEQFGMMFENDQVLDKVNNLQVENLPIISVFPTPHPIIEGLNSVCFRAGCSLTSTAASNISVIVSGPSAEPFSTPLLLAGESGEGRVVASGSYEMFRDKITGGYSYETHPQLALNIFNWMKTTKRERLHAQGSVRAPNSAIPIEGSPITTTIENNTTPTNFAAVPNPVMQAAPNFVMPQMNFESSVKIMSKEQLYKAFEQMITGFYSFKEAFLQGFEVFKANMENLMKAIIASENDMIQVNQQSAAPSSVPQSVNSIPDPAASASPVPAAPSIPPAPKMPPALTPPPQANPPPIGPSISTSSTPNVPSVPIFNNATPATTGTDLPALTPLPMRRGGIAPPPLTITPPPQPMNQEPVAFTPQPEPTPEPMPEPPKVEDTTTTSDSGNSLGKSKEDLEAELKGLENKLSSVRDLRTFVDKKLEAGKLKPADHEKQVKKLESDISKTKYRIDEIKTLLSKM